jgi:cephalosporin-C deacetylase-like acetyl esterase
MYTGPYTLLAPEWYDFMAVTLGLGRGDGIHLDGRNPVLTAAIENNGFEAIEGTVSWRVHHETWRMSERGGALSSKTVKHTFRPGSDTSVTNRFHPPAPGFYHVTCAFTREGGDRALSRSMLMGFAPESAGRPPDAPGTLKAFWDEARAELAAVDPMFKLIPRPEHSTPHIDCYLVEMRSLGDVRIRGWYEVPKTPGPHPALLRVPGYTGRMQPAGRFKDMIILSLDIRGHGNSQDDVPGGKPEFLLRGIDDPKSYFYRGAYMDCIRGLDFLASRDEVDPKRLGVTGGSQGGMLSLATAALDARVMLCAPDIPYVIDSGRAFDITEWPGSIIRDWLVRNPDTCTMAGIHDVLGFFDPKNLAGWIRCPVFMGIGLQDSVCPAPTNFAAYNLITSEKQCRVYPFAGHGLPGEHYVEQSAWIRATFAGRRQRPSL